MSNFNFMELDNDTLIASAVHGLWYAKYRGELWLSGDLAEDLWKSYLRETEDGNYKVAVTKEELLNIAQERFFYDPRLEERYYAELKRYDYEKEKRNRAFLLILAYGNNCNVNDDLIWEKYKERYGEDIKREELFDLVTEKLLENEPVQDSDIIKIKELRAKKKLKKFGH